MAVVDIGGLDALRRRLASLGTLTGVDIALRAEAEALAAAASARLEERGGEGELARSVEILDESQASISRYAIGTALPLGRYLEFGTTRRRAFPWLGPAFHGRLPAVNHTLGKLLSGALKALGRA